MPHSHTRMIKALQLASHLDIYSKNEQLSYAFRSSLTESAEEMRRLYAHSEQVYREADNARAAVQRQSTELKAQMSEIRKLRKQLPKES